MQPVGQLPAQNRRIEKPPGLAQSHEEEEHANQDTSGRQPYALAIERHVSPFSLMPRPRSRQRDARRARPWTSPPRPHADRGRSWNAISFSAAMRAAIGGCDANRSDTKPSFKFIRRPSGSVIHRCAEPWLIARVGATAASIFSKARASPIGLRVSSAPDASARYSRRRDTIIASNWAISGARR